MSEIENMTTEQALARPEQADFERMDAFDEEQILAELRGSAVLEDYFYEFTNKEGKLVVGLSWNGIKAFSHSMSRLGIPLSTEKVEFEDLGDRVRAKAYVRFMPTGEIHIGISHQNKKMEVWANKEKTEKKLIDDPYYDEKASSKAKRNGIRECIPEQAINAEYKRWKAQKQSGKWPEPPSAEAVANAVPRGKSKATESQSDEAKPIDSGSKGRAVKKEFKWPLEENSSLFQEALSSPFAKITHENPDLSFKFSYNQEGKVDAVTWKNLQKDGATEKAIDSLIASLPEEQRVLG